MTQTAQQAAAETARRVRTEPNQRRVRVFFGGEAVADSSKVFGRPGQVTAWREGMPYVAELAEHSAGR